MLFDWRCIFEGFHNRTVILLYDDGDILSYGIRAVKYLSAFPEILF